MGSQAYDVIAFTALGEFGIPTSFTTGWLASSIAWGGGNPEELADGLDIGALIQAATADEALQQL
ncbi:hypothetical protein ACFV1W_39115 [Kitasatospora sp. NPDC059648]|uniref:hypothetical protein n=1 Tax=Kitasatospora sp. NPDC059648 TaxID=3346894 RepID=UPI0036A4270D